MTRFDVLRSAFVCLVACGGGAAATGGGEHAEREAEAERSCEVPEDCVLLPRTCCGTCGAPSPSDAVALARAPLAAHAYACEGTGGCPDCFALAPPGLVATCRRGRCEVDYSPP